jgi:FkbM family methyltransferase
MQPLVRRGYSAYRGSFLYPHLGGLLKRWFRMRSRLARRRSFIHDLGPFRMRLDLNQLIDTSIYYMGTWEAESIAAIRRLLPQGGTAVDIGANIGFMTLHMAVQVGPRGQVISFEPTSWAVDRLQQNLALNLLPQVTVVHAGLGSRNSFQPDVLTPYSYPLLGEQPVMHDSITIRTLDGYLDEHPLDRLDLIKCDTDGCELRVLEGATRTVQRFRPALLLEVNPAGLADQGDSAQRLADWLEAAGYRLFHEDGRPFNEDLESTTEALGRTEHDIDILALPKNPAN